MSPLGEHIWLVVKVFGLCYIAVLYIWALIEFPTTDTAVGFLLRAPLLIIVPGGFICAPVVIYLLRAPVHFAVTWDNCFLTATILLLIYLAIVIAQKVSVYTVTRREYYHGGLSLKRGSIGWDSYTEDPKEVTEINHAGIAAWCSLLLFLVTIYILLPRLYL